METSSKPSGLQHVQYEVAEGVATLTLDRPAQLNAFCVPMHEEIRACLAHAETEARALLLTGAGRGFCAGQDLSERKVAPGGERPDLGRSIDTWYKPLILQLRALRIPTVCAVNGVAAGAGVSLALACDITLAARSAKFVLAFVKIGLMPDSGSTFFLPRLIGHARTAALAMLGEPVSAEKAAEWGMIWACVDDAVLQAEARALALRMAAGPRQAYMNIRAALDGATARDLEAQLTVERDGIAALGRTDDYREGVDAFAQKRAPVFKGS